MPRYACIAVTTVAVVIGGGASPRTQQAGPGKEPVFKTGVDLITVDVVVVDSEGRPLRGLDASDFVVTVAGEPRTVVTAEFIDVAGARDASGREPAVLPVSTNEGASIGRQLVIVVDEQTLELGRVLPVAEAAARLLGSLSPADRSALIRLPNGPNEPFTWVHDRVQDALRRAVGTSALAGGIEFASLWEAREIANGNANAARNLSLRECGGQFAGGLGGSPGGQATGPSGTQGGPTTTPGEQGAAPGSSGAAASGGANNVFESNCMRGVRARAEVAWRSAQMTSFSSMGALRNALAALKGVPGDKTVLLISGGWPLDERDELTLAAQVAADAASARATLFTLFVPAASNAPIHRFPSSTPVEDQLIQSRPLETIAGMTGGGAFRAWVGAEAAFDRIAREMSAYYRIGVEKTLVDNDGRGRSLRVRVSQNGATVRARELFDVPTYQDRDWAARLAAALEAPVVATDLGLRVASYVAPDPDGGGSLQVVLAGEASRVAPGDATFKMLVKDVEGRSVVHAEPPAGRPSDGTVAFSTRFPVPAGRYVVRLAIMDGAGRTGSVDHRVDVRLASLGEVTVTEPLLVRVPASPLRQPALAVSDVRQDERLALQVSLRAPEGRIADPAVAFEIAGSENGPTLVAATADVTSSSPGGWVLGQAVVDLRVLPPGRYVVRARITADGLPLGQVRRAFVVAGASSPPSAVDGPTAPDRPQPGVGPAAFAPQLRSAPAFALSATLTSPILPTFLDRVAARPDAGTPAVRDLIDRARTEGVEQLAIPETLAAGEPIAAFLRGLTLLSRNDLDAAADAFRGTMRGAPDFYPAMVYLGVCYAAAGQDKSAAAAWRTAMIREGDTRALHLLLIDALLRQRAGDAALGAVTNARARWPADDELKRRFVLAALLAGRSLEGFQALDELVEADAADEPSLAAGLFVLYHSFERGVPVQDVETDRARMTRLATAYRETGGPSVALVDAWLDIARRR